MRKSTRSWLLAVACSLFVQPSFAGIAEGLQWLSTQQQSDGRYSSPGDIATDDQATGEAIRASQSVSGAANQSSAISWLNGPALSGTEFLSRQIVVNVRNGSLSPTLLTQLTSRQNTDDSFGEYSGYDGTPLDTAFALEALADAGRSNTDAVSYALQYLISKQQADGSWKDINGDASVYVTALAMKAIWSHRKQYSLSASLTKAKGYLLSARGSNQLWDETYQSALALIGLSAVLTDRSPIQGSLTALANLQSPNGSWLGSAYTTALAIRALSGAAAPSPDESMIYGRVVDGDSNQPLLGVNISLAGPSAKSVTTLSSGKYQFNDLAPGPYSLTFEKTGYSTVTATTTLAVGKQLNVGDIALLKQTAGATTGSIRGRITDRATGAPIAGATIRVSNGASAVTDADGAYFIPDVAPGPITLLADAPGYTVAQGQSSVVAGGRLIFSPSLESTTGGSATIQGTITDADTGSPIAGASVSTTGNAGDTTAADGTYSFSSTAGQQTLTVSAQGYASAIAVVQIAPDSILNFAAALYPESPSPDPVPGKILGTVRDATSGLPIAGATVEVISGGSASVQTDEFGSYVLDNLAAGRVVLHVTKAGYEFVLAGADIQDDTVTTFSPALEPEPAPEPATVVGVVVDATTNEPMTGATINAVWTAGGANVASNASGQFVVDQIPAKEVSLTFSATGFVAVEYVMPLIAGETLDLGQIRMRPEEVEQLLPDLVVDGVPSVAQLVIDPQTFSATGTVTATIKNVGTAIQSTPFQVSAFLDRDQNGTLSEADLVVGSVDIGQSLLAEESIAVELSVTANLLFRDPAILVMADSALASVELSETNNVGSSGSECRRIPDADITPRVKWRWLGSTERPGVRDVFGPAMVGQMTDDNGDGQISVTDTPDVVFAAFDTSAANPGYLTAVDGATGQTIWQSVAEVTPTGSPSIADIDGDGVVEILTVNRNRTQIMAFEHTGTLKWTATTLPQFTTDGSGARDNLSIADLNADGSPEIIHGRRVYSASGAFLWTGSQDIGGQPTYGILSIAADINHDGKQEVISGRSAYSSTGALLWNNTSVNANGFNGIGNFDADDFPEIVVVANGRVWLLEHTGTIKWGPITIPGGGVGGPPTVADVDGDGQPEIGVAGSARYVVLETNGSIKWQRVVQDVSSNRTGSSVFDLDGDEKAEVLYADELAFRIMDGSTGNVLYQMPNWSGTILEYPVIADIDGDTFAEVLVGSQRSTTPEPDSIGGLAALEGANGEWMPTRAIWNQHAYHITNINDDGTVPAVEQKSWLTHNSYRLNTFLDRNPLDAPDLTVGFLRLEDSAGGNRRLSARVGNGGLVSVAQGALVSFYNGNPSAGGTLIQSTQIAAVPAGGYLDVTISPATNLTGAEIWVVVDSDDRIGECNEQNNSHHIPFAAATALGDITVSTDALVYGSAADAVLSASATNIGSLSNQYTIELIVEDVNGEVVIRFAPTPTGVLAGGAAVSMDQVWNTGTTIAGNYILRGILRRNDGALVDEATAPFAIEAPTVRASLRVNTDRPVYHTTDRVSIGNLAINLAPNQAIVDPQIVVRVSNPSGVEVLNQTLPLLELAPGGLAERMLEQLLADAVEGVYTVNGTLLDGSGAVLATASTQYTVESDTKIDLIGQVTTDPTEVPRGDPLVCTDSVTNRGPRVLSDQLIRRSLIRLDVEQDIDQIESTVNLAAAGGNEVLTRSIDTTDLEQGDYACALEALVGDTYIPLGHAVFKVLEPRVELVGQVTANPVEVPLGEPLQCTDTVTNNGSMARPGQSIRRKLIRTDVAQEIDTIESSINLPLEGNQILTRTIDSLPLEEGDYACTLEAKIGDSYVLLDKADFKVLPPLADLEGTLEVGPRGRLLVLMDPPGVGPSTDTLCHTNQLGLALEVDLDHPLEPDTVVQVKLLNALGLLVDTESVKLGDFVGVVDTDIGTSRYDLKILDLSADSVLVAVTGSGLQDLLGNNYRIVTDVQRATGNLSFSTGLISLTCNAQMALGDVINDTFAVVGLGNQLQNRTGNGIGDGVDRNPADVQRTHLEQLLTGAGWTYKIHTDPAAFGEDLRSGGYVAYLLLSEYKVLDEQSQKVLREAVYRGDGLFVAGRHDVRTRILDPVLGLKYKGQHFQPGGVQVDAVPPFVAGYAAFGEGDIVQRVLGKGAATVGNVLPRGLNDTIVSQFAFGAGKSVLAGFDVLAESLFAGPGSLFDEIIRQPLPLIHPDPQPTQASRVVPVHFAVDNQSVETTARMKITTSPGSHVIQTTQGDIVAGGIEWELELAEGESQSVDFWVQLPPGGIETTVSAKIEAIDGSVVYDQGTVTLDLEPIAPPSIDDAIAGLAAYVATQPASGLITQLVGLVADVRTPAKRALDHLNAANTALTGGNVELALNQILSASTELMRDTNPLVLPIRQKVSQVATDAARLQ